MLFGGVGRPKLVCGVATNRRATRVPISFGELPDGHELKFVSALTARRPEVVAATAHMLKRTMRLFIPAPVAVWIRCPGGEL
jgi:hypothetical protein